MFTINGERWWVVLVEPDDPVLMMPSGRWAYGVCNDSTKTISINRLLYGDFFEKVLCHELVHAAMFAYDITLNYDEEELIAEIIATFGEEIVDKTDMIFDKIRRERF